MSIRLHVPEPIELRPRLTVIGVGGAGCNAVNNMISAGLDGVDFIVANTDAQALLTAKTPNRIQLGQTLTEGLGAGSKPEIGEAAAREAEEDLKSRIAGSHMLFIAAGMGGGTGTGAAAVIARVAKELGILTVAVVTKPFLFEGSRRMRVAEAGVAELKKVVDTLIVIPNQNLFRIADERTTFAEAFILADQVLYSGVACIVDLIVKEGLINLDLADVKTVLTSMGPAVMGTGEAEGDRRAVRAAEAAIENKLIDDVSLVGAKGLLLSIIGGRDLTLYEVDEAASRVRQEVDPDANIIVGAAFDDTLGDRVRVSIVASGLATGGQRAEVSGEAISQRRPPEPVARATPPAPTPRDVALPATTRAPVETPAPRTGPPPLPPSSSTVPAPVRPAPPQEISNSWRTNDGVMVSDLAAPPPRPVPNTIPAPGAGAARPNHDTAATGSIFVPQPAVEVPRKAARMPEIGDFPGPIQKAYAERSAPTSRSELASAPVSPATMPQPQPGPTSDPRKSGLFKRLADAARGRPRADSEAVGDEEMPDFLSADPRARRQGPR